MSRQDKENIAALVDTLNFKEKVDRSLALIERAYDELGDSLVVANSLGKDSVAVWHLSKRVNLKIRGFIVTTRFKLPETVRFMKDEAARYPELEIYQNNEEIPPRLYETEPDLCCEILKVKPIRQGYRRDGGEKLGDRP